MKKLLILLLPLLSICEGCTTTSLERHTVNQSQSAADYRYQATLHCLAMVAAHPDTLPSYALLSNGTTSVTDTGILSPAVTWSGAPEIFASAALAATGSRSPSVSWTVDPIADYTQLEAMRCACRCVLDGQIDPKCTSVLTDPETATAPGPHFGVIGRLTQLPTDWLHHGRLCDVPACACYKDHYGDMWVWVTSDGLEGLAGFTLVLQDIATLNVAPTDNSLPANKTPPLVVTLWVVDNTLNQMKQLAIDIAVDGTPTPETKVVTVGQPVVWRNAPNGLTVSVSGANDAFKTGTIASGQQSNPVVIDQATYAKLGGKGEDMIIPYTIAPPAKITFFGLLFPKNDASKRGQIKLRPDPYKGMYSQSLVTRVDRVIKPEPENVCAIQSAIKTAFDAQAGGEPMPQVMISWAKWMELTTPFQNQRTASKPGAATTAPVTQPTNRNPFPGFPPVPDIIRD